jgi:hypothetical protein
MKTKFLKGVILMNKLIMVKGAVGLVITVGVGAIVGNAIKATTPSNVKIITKICIGVSSLILSSMIGDFVSDYTEKQIDKGIEFVKGVEKTVEESS